MKLGCWAMPLAPVVGSRGEVRWGFTGVRVSAF